MQDYLKTQKKYISVVLSDYLDQKAHQYSTINRWGADTMKRIRDFALAGKMIRGSMVILGQSLFDPGWNSENPGGLVQKPDQNSLHVAAAMELFQAGFLIHDDIMDRDFSRRGSDTVFYQYEKLARKTEGDGVVGEARHFGQSMGICAGDAAFFLAFDLLGALQVPAATKDKILGLACREITGVALAQMQDVWAGFTTEPATRHEIMNLFRYKTARYTFTMPLLLGAFLGNVDDKTRQILEKTGDLLGIIFQMKDDELGLFGEQKGIGKPVGTDIREGKQTLFVLEMTRRLQGEELNRLNQIAGNQDATEEQLLWFRNKVTESGIKADLHKTMEDMADEVRACIVELSPPDASRTILESIVDYSLRREA